MKYRLIEDDFYHIARRIKYINRFYELRYNLQKHIFEVHDKRRKSDSLCFVVGSRLDGKALRKAVNTQAKFARDIFKSIENCNRKIDEKNEEHLRDFAHDKLYEYADYLDRHPSSDISFDSSKKTIWL